MTNLDLHYVDPRLVALYDRDNPRGADTDFFLAFAKEINAKRIIDLGCGTGLITCEFVRQGYEMIGVDPATEMLADARKKEGADQVLWLQGDASVLQKHDADMAYMTGNVAQVFLEEEDWLSTLTSLHSALKQDGYLVFESRNPLAKGWEKWQKAFTFEQFVSLSGPLTCWLDLDEVGDGFVRFHAHNVFEDSGEDLIVQSILRFRTREEITRSLEQTGFAVKTIYGYWNREPLVDSSPLMIFVAQCLD